VYLKKAKPLDGLLPERPDLPKPQSRSSRPRCRGETARVTASFPCGIACNRRVRTSIGYIIP